MPGIPSMPSTPSESPQVRKDQMKEIRELGRKFIDTIHNFAAEKGSDVPYLIVVGAADYILKAHRARVAALGEKWTQNFIALEDKAQSEGIKTDEPYTYEQPNIEQLLQEHNNFEHKESTLD